MADLGETSARVREAMDCRSHRYPASLDVAVGEDHDATLADLIPGRDGQWERAEIWAVLWAALRTLPPRERRILHLRFFEDLTQQEIARELGVTQMQISRIHARTLRTLQDRIVNGCRENKRRA